MRRHSERGADEYARAARLAAVFAEEDAEIAARMREVPEVAYKFICKRCKSRFSLAQELEAHESECRRAGNTNKLPGRTPPSGIPCKRCQALGKDPRFPNIAEQMRHVRAEHADDFQAKHSAGVRQRRKKQKKADRGTTGKQRGRTPGSSPQRPRTSPPATQPDEVTCPTCGGPLPAKTAQLVGELTAAGFSQVAALDAARIARRILGGQAGRREGE